ncbi:MAG: hypothetical protein ABH891_00025 [Candidatus Omnitrophota bacterium]
MKATMFHLEDSGFIEKNYFPRVLADFSWIDGFFKTQALVAELEEVSRERNQIATAPLPKNDRMQGLETSFKSYFVRRQAILREFLGAYPTRGDCFRYLTSDSIRVGTRNLRFPPALSWEEVKSAFDSLPEAAGAISQEKKEKIVGKLTTRIEELEKEIVEAFPSRYHGPNGTDLRETFVRFWIGLQNQCNAPVTPEGWLLEDHGTGLERAAWRKLNLVDFVNLKNGLEPHKQ